MFFNKKNRPSGLGKLIISFFFSLIFFVFFQKCLLPEENYIVDRICAVIDNEVITLTDLKIVRTFFLNHQDEPLSMILNHMIDQKLVTRMTDPEISIDPIEIDSYMKKVGVSLSLERFKQALQKYRMNEDDLKPYVEESLLYQKIIAKKFNQVVIVRLKEIEDYYNETYVPQQKELGKTPPAIVEILDELESSIRKIKIENQVEEWKTMLRNEVGVEILWIPDEESL